MLKGEYDQVRTIAEQEEPEYEPRADTIRGGAAIVRAMSKTRTKRQAEEAQRIHEERMEPIGENETMDWDGLRRRKTTSTSSGSIVRRKTVHPPLGMTHFPDDNSEADSELHPGFFGRLGRKSTKQKNTRSGRSPVPLGSVSVHSSKAEEEGLSSEHVYGLPAGLRKQADGNAEADDDDTSYHGASSGPRLQWAGDMTERERASSRGSSLAPPRPPPHAVGPSAGAAKRQFSFQNVFHRNKSSAGSGDHVVGQEDLRPKSRGALSFVGKNHATTEEERLGLVHGDSSKNLPKYEEGGGGRSSDEWQVTSGTASSPEEITGDLGQGARGRRDPYDEYDDDLYDEPLRSPRGSSEERERGGSSRGGGGAFV